MPEIQKLRPSRLFLDAIRQSDLSLFQKLQVRLAYRVPKIREDIDEYIDAVVGDSSTQADGTIIKIILEHLPEIMALIELLLKLIG
jgi:hypothetical protein